MNLPAFHRGLIAFVPIFVSAGGALMRIWVLGPQEPCGAMSRGASIPSPSTRLDFRSWPVTVRGTASRRWLPSRRRWRSPCVHGARFQPDLRCLMVTFPSGQGATEQLFERHHLASKEVIQLAFES